jgi:hypothetical protein
MSYITNRADSYQSGIEGAGPAEWFSNVALDGTAGQAVSAPVGSKRHKGNITHKRMKAAHATLSNRTDDWVQGLHCITQTVLFSQFTDGGSTAGTFVLTETIPINAFVIQTTLINLTGFTGDTSAVIVVGDGSDVDRYNTGTPSVFTTVAGLAMGVPSGVKDHLTAGATVTITVTSAADFTAVVAGQFTIRIYYLN